MRTNLTAIAIALSFVSPAWSAESELTFERHIRPILKAHCFDCHGASDEPKAGLDLRLRRLMVQGGESGAAVVPGKPGESLLLARVRSCGNAARGSQGPRRRDRDSRALARRGRTDRTRRTPDGGQRHRDHTGGTRVLVVSAHSPSSAADVYQFRPGPHADRCPARCKDGRARLAFSPDADRRTLIRRAYLDLLGLPPTPSEVDAFLSDERPDAYEKLIDRLLASEHYGERWARHWLDVAGYADSEGFTDRDADRPWAYRYRDYVIRSLNEDKPFDQFIREQLAGDEMVPRPYKNLTADQIETLTATGFLRMAVDGTGSGANDDPARNRTIADTIKIVSTSLLGLSVGCAQCHDHRYDPILQADYYELRAVFEPALDYRNWRTPSARLVSLYTDEDRAKAATVEAEAQKIAAKKSEKQKQFIDEALRERTDEARGGDPRQATRGLQDAERQADRGAKTAAQAIPQRQHHRGQPVPVQPETRRRTEGVRQTHRRRPQQETGRRVPPRTDRGPGQGAGDAGLLPRRLPAADRRRPAGRFDDHRTSRGSHQNRGKRPGTTHNGAAAGLRELAHERQASAGRPRFGQPRLAQSLRTRHRRHAGRLRCSLASAPPIRNCSTGWRTSSSHKAGVSRNSTS